MSKKNKFFIGKGQVNALGAKRPVSSLLDVMEEGREYASLLDIIPQKVNLRDEICRAIAEVEAVRNRPVIIYATNVIKSLLDTPTSINVADDLPFAELIDSVPREAHTIDIVIVTPGGFAYQVSQFVSRLRPRFRNVGFILPHRAMSAGTLWALSGDEIWMDERAFLGPIDPQVPGKDGRLIPAQALLTLLKRIQETGEESLKQGRNPAWSDIQLLRNIDAKELGDALAQTQYSIQLAANYLENYKFRDWLQHRDGTPVTPAERSQRALEVAAKLCSHEQWKVHSHGISRDIAWQELKIKIGHPETVEGFQRALRRLWALLYWVFDTMMIAKIFIGQNYSLFRSRPRGSTQ